MAEPKTLSELCAEACDDCALQCSGSAFQGEMMGGMELAASLGRVCSDACSNLATQLRSGQVADKDVCATACLKFIPEAENSFRHLDSFKQSAAAAKAVVERIGELGRVETVAK